MKTCTFTAEQETAVIIALEKRIEWLEHNIKICAEIKEPAHALTTKLFQDSYAEALGAYNAVVAPDFIPKMHPDEEMTF